MKVYDTANRLAAEIKESEEYKLYKASKEKINQNPELKAKIEEFEKVRYDAQVLSIKQGDNNQEKLQKLQELYEILVQKVKKNYPGRASIGPLLDLFISFLEMGKNKYKELIKERKEKYKILIKEMENIANKYEEKVIAMNGNKISILFTLNIRFFFIRNNFKSITFWN